MALRPYDDLFLHLQGVEDIPVSAGHVDVISGSGRSDTNCAGT